jgi:hypothetical protein
MEDSILSSPAKGHVAKEKWGTPVRATVRALRRDGVSWGQIFKTGVTKSSAQRMCSQSTSRSTRKGKAMKPKLISVSDINRAIAWMTTSWVNRTAPYSRVRAACNIKASTNTLRRELRLRGYKRCIACKRPFITKAQAKRRLAFAKKYRWWGTKE